MNSEIEKFRSAVDTRACLERIDRLSEVPWNYFFYYPEALDLSTYKQVMAPHMSEFVNLIHVAKQVDSFKMVGHKQFEEYPASGLSVITLSGDGDISTYQSEDIECSDRSFYTWNIVSGKDNMPRSNSSQDLLQKILPIPEARKAAWSSGNIALDTRTPAESIIIYIRRYKQ